MKQNRKQWMKMILLALLVLCMAISAAADEVLVTQSSSGQTRHLKISREGEVTIPDYDTPLGLETEGDEAVCVLQIILPAAFAASLVVYSVILLRDRRRLAEVSRQKEWTEHEA